jgi:hypothetical protein
MFIVEFKKFKKEDSRTTVSPGTAPSKVADCQSTTSRTWLLRVGSENTVPATPTASGADSPHRPLLITRTL